MYACIHLCKHICIYMSKTYMVFSVWNDTERLGVTGCAGEGGIHACEWIYRRCFFAHALSAFFQKSHKTLPLSQFWNWNSKILGNTILAALCWPEIKLRSATIEISSHIAMEMELRPGWRQMSLLQSGGHNHQNRHRGFKAIRMARQGISGSG